jgi:hypothetical protein
MDCYRPNYYSPAPPCSDHGYCNKLTNICECYDGFSSYSESKDIYGYDCDQDTAGIRLLGFSNVVVSGIAFLLFSRIVYYRHFVKMEKFTEPIVLCPLFHALEAAHHFVYGLLKARSSTQWLIHNSPLLNLAMCGGVFFFICGNCQVFFFDEL